MARLTIEEVKATKEYLESQPERIFIGSTGLTQTEKDLFDTIQAQHEELVTIAAQSLIYKKFVTTLSTLLQEHVEEDGYCRMIVKKDEVDKLLEALPEIPEELIRATTRFDFKYDIGQTVYYLARPERLTKDEIVLEGVIRGFQIKKNKDGYDIGVDFGKHNNIPMVKVSDSREFLEYIANRYTD